MKISIQADNSRSLTVPADLDNHMLVHRKYFYTLPPSLLRLFVDAVGGDRFDGELLNLEFALSEHVGDHGYAVGVLNGVVLAYHLLGVRKAVQISEEYARRLGWSNDDAVATAQTLNERLDTFGIPVRGYAGWLLTNPEFLNEHDDLFRRNQDDVREFGIPKPVMTNPVFERGQEDSAGCGDHAQFALEFRDFCHRWRLQTFVGPYLPWPIEPQVPNLLSQPEGLAACEGMTTFSLPDIFPVSGRGELQSSVDDAVNRGEKPGHLADWFEIIDSTNSAKNPISRYVRLFQFQHFVRVLYGRHAAALYRKKTHLLDSLAEFIGVSTDTIKSDWRFLDVKVGKNWQLRPDPLG